jgi:hypothetical protein
VLCREAPLVTDQARTSDQPAEVPGPEIFIGLVGAVGTDLYLIRETLKRIKTNELYPRNHSPK